MSDCTCGVTSVDSDFVVALNTDQYGTGADCLEQITMTYGGKSTVATIVDECSGCPYGGLDLSPALFEFFAPLSDGAIDGTWSFTDS
ncbi:hypothetical protein H0H92_012464 [Tricholoma furcatifolium]|nr:hypothetical protein H0H92_012464 [Tricholoma furcatifolium]